MSILYLVTPITNSSNICNGNDDDDNDDGDDVDNNDDVGNDDNAIGNRNNHGVILGLTYFSCQHWMARLWQFRSHRRRHL